MSYVRYMTADYTGRGPDKCISAPHLLMIICIISSLLFIGSVSKNHCNYCGT